MEPSKEAIAVRLTRLNRQILGKVTSGNTTNFSKRTIDREALLDALTVLYDECNDDPVKKCDELVRAFVDKYRSTLAELRRTRVCIADFELLQVIGRGHFGDVHMVREKQTGDVYALKVVRKEAAARRAACAGDERDVLAAAAAPCLPKLQYAFQDNTNLYLVMELCSGGDLASLLSRRSEPLCERDAAFYVAETAHALRTLHNLGFVHRDVKPHNILLDRCGHIKLGDFGSATRLSSDAAAPPPATADYVAPELLAAAACAARHAVCLDCCRGLAPAPATACDYWSLGVVAFELVTLRRPFSSDDDDSVALILSNIQRYERSDPAELPFAPPPAPPSPQWRALVAGLLRVHASKRFNYLDTLQHPALKHLTMHTIRDQAPPWVPSLRGPEDASCFAPAPREKPPAPQAPFRTRAPFAGQLPFVGFSYVAPEDNEDSISGGGFNASHDCTAIDLATFKSAEKLAVMRAREIASLQGRLAAAEAAAAADAEHARRGAEAEAERVRAALQAEVTALSAQNKRLERELDIDKQERMSLERTIQEMTSSAKERANSELRRMQAKVAEMEVERNLLREEQKRLETKVEEMNAQCERNLAAADSARAQQRHYKEIIGYVQDLSHRRLTEISVRPIESMAKERALRRQTLSGCEADSRAVGARIAAAEATAAKETRAKDEAERKLLQAEQTNRTLQVELSGVKEELGRVQECYSDKKRVSEASSEQLRQAQLQLTEEKVKSAALLAQVQELQSELAEVHRREAALEELASRTERRLQERVNDADSRAASAAEENARHREKVNSLEQLVRQLEREVSALEARKKDAHSDAHSDTESVGEDAHSGAQVQLLKEQLARAEAQLQARTEEMAALRQEARTANLERWRKERELNDLSVTHKTSERELKRLEERIDRATELRKAAEQKAAALQTEVDSLRPRCESVSKELELTKKRLERLMKEHEVASAEVDRSRNDILKLKSELQYSEKRRIRAEQQEELGGRERAALRDDAAAARAEAASLVQNSKALQEACSLMEEQLTDLERLTDLHEQKNKELEKEVESLRSELSSCSVKLAAAERAAVERDSKLRETEIECEEAKEQLGQALNEIDVLRDRLDDRTDRIASLESQLSSSEDERQSLSQCLAGAGRHSHALQEECAALRTRAAERHRQAMELQQQLNDAQEEIAALKEAADAAAAWWRTRETKADATLRQQAKLIDFLQTKIEEGKHKKSHKWFGKSPARGSAGSPPLRRANRELRDEVGRLRKQLSSVSGSGINDTLATPKRDTFKKARDLNINKSLEGEKKTQVNGVMSIDMPDGTKSSKDDDDTVKIVWSDGHVQERVRVRCSSGALIIVRDGRELRARLVSTTTQNLLHNEAQRGFTIKIDSDSTPSEASVVCSTIEQRAQFITQLTPAASRGYAPAETARLSDDAAVACWLGSDAVAFGCSKGIYSLRGQIRLEHKEQHMWDGPVSALAAAATRVVVVSRGQVLHGSLHALESALRRAPNLSPTLQVEKVYCLPEGTTYSLLQAIQGDAPDAACVAVAGNQRVFLLRYDFSREAFTTSRSLTVDRRPSSLLLTPAALYIAGERPLKLKLPSGVLEHFAMENATVSAAAKKHSPPKAILLIREHPAEILICYNECGVFVDENGKKTRSEEPKWSIAADRFEFVSPFLYIVGSEMIDIVHVNDESYRAPPCTCDTDSVASSDCYATEHVFHLKVTDCTFLGKAPNGILIQSKVGGNLVISTVEGMAAFRSIGASVESLATISDTKGSTVSLAQSTTDPSTEESSRDASRRESVESREQETAFQADIRKRATQLRQKQQRQAAPSNDVIKAVLTTELSLKRSSKGSRKSAPIEEETDSDTSQEKENKPRNPADLCAEMFTKQVKFQKI
ncbi:citron rho-interacting kinase [Plutella xylostella]|uniref:citron rho-interacting kinase n=1 Tax=Plutella xylostella TaxID=51655 RepID=UPI0020326622|nr:citron rho-interacting kinase [Plutella xylostella]